MESIVRVPEQVMGLDEFLDLVQLRDGQRVEGVAGDGGGVAAELRVGGELNDMRVFGLEAVLGGGAPGRVGGAA